MNVRCGVCHSNKIQVGSDILKVSENRRIELGIPVCM
jgi:hypothetical protein